MGKATVYTEALRRAANAMGGEARLADVLGVPLAQARSWLEGSEHPPTEIYHRVLDLLISTGAH
jgi:AraC-like DNA-binding protein